MFTSPLPVGETDEVLAYLSPSEAIKLAKALAQLAVNVVVAEA